MPLKDELGKRMKEFYETVPRTKLMRRCPVVIRVDGKTFHSFSRGFGRPFDMVLMEAMQQTMKKLCEEIQGCVLGYQQSDEISLLLIDYQKLETSAWFDYEVQKICSVAASLATMFFNRSFLEKEGEFTEAHRRVAGSAVFDARCFNLPKEEVTNYFYWRQLDASRNSIQMVGQANFSHRELDRKSCVMIQDMLMLRKGINWNNLDTCLKRGCCCIRAAVPETAPPLNGSRARGQEAEPLPGVGCAAETAAVRKKWMIDREIPRFAGEGREYIDRLVYVGE